MPVSPSRPFMDLRGQLQATLGSSYTLERELGGGGMSRVFVAEEKAFGRRIVVKVLPADTAAGVSVERFKREIQVVARLQHPHIVPVLSAGELSAEGTLPLPYYTMPFVKGESLRARLSRGGELSVTEAIHVLRDVAAALAYAHSEGVVHRDIKPDNVIVSGGVAVVTDFGVAKAVDVAATDTGHAHASLTSLGVALGTPAYMSPEQASADPHVDHRADIYSFGCLAYELLAGSSPFAGRPPQQILAAHVAETPEPLHKRRPNAPPTLAALVKRCLEKRPGDRPQSAEELLAALDMIATTPSGGMSPTAERLKAVSRGGAKWIIGTVAVAIAVLGTQLWLRLNAVRPFMAGSATPIATSPDIELQPAISPDGKLVAFVSYTAAGNRLFVRQVDGDRATLLADDVEGEHTFPHWLPDGSRISFYARDGIFVVPALTGGSAKRVAEAGHALANVPGVGTHAWSRDGQWLAITRPDGIWLHAMAGPDERRVAGGVGLHSPSFSPDGRLLAYANGNYPTMSNVSPNAIWIIRLPDGKPVRISDSSHVNLSPVWAPDGRSVLYISSRENTRDVYQQAVSSRGAPRGEAVRITTGLSPFAISLSDDASRLAFDVVRNYSNVWWLDVPASGMATFAAARQLTRENQHIEGMALSHDGRWIAYDSDRGGNADIYKVRVDGGDPVQVTTNPANDFAPAWSPDDREIAFHSPRTGDRDIYVIGSEGTGEQHVTEGPLHDYYPSWAADGQQLAFVRAVAAIGPVNVVRRSGGRWGAASVVDSGMRMFPSWSDDGRWIVAASADGSVVLLDMQHGGARRTLATSRDLDGGSAVFTRWSRDSRTVFVGVGKSGSLGVAVQRNTDVTIWMVPVSGGRPRRLLAEDRDHHFGRVDFATDGKRLFFTLAQWEADVSVIQLKH